MLVGVDDGVALAALDGDRRDVLGEEAALLRLLGAHLAAIGEGVLVGARHLEGLRDIFARLGHRIGAVLRLHQAVDEAPAAGRVVDVRSEEHTSELQSLMRISYAVICLKKKTTEYNCYMTRNATSNA